MEIMVNSGQEVENSGMISPRLQHTSKKNALNSLRLGESELNK
jgi:hypothetical protein